MKAGVMGAVGKGRESIRRNSWHRAVNRLDIYIGVAESASLQDAAHAIRMAREQVEILKYLVHSKED